MKRHANYASEIDTNSCGATAIACQTGIFMYSSFFFVKFKFLLFYVDLLSLLPSFMSTPNSLNMICGKHKDTDTEQAHIRTCLHVGVGGTFENE